MTMMKLSPLPIAAVLALAPALSGQSLTQANPDPRLYLATTPAAEAAAAAEAEGGAPMPVPQLGDWVGFAKWVSLGSAAGLGTLGFVLKRDADRMFDRLHTRCRNDPDLCRQRAPDGSYSDAALESLFQRVVDRDTQAQLSLIAAQVTFGLSVVFFIADFQRGEGPSNIPYDPPEEEGANRVELSAVPGALAIRWYVD